MEIQARLSHDKVNHSQDNHVHLVVSLKAPQLDQVAKRPPICVIPVVDISGSMRGDKLEYAKKSMLKLVDQLQPGDITGLVTFSEVASVPMLPVQVTAESKEVMRKHILNLQVRGGTNLFDGVSRATKVVNDLDLGPQFVKRLIMFTDGQSTHGVTDKGQIRQLVNSSRGPVTISAFGYGSGSDVWNGCDQDFLMACSQDWAGNYAYVQDPDDVLTAFGRELGGLLSTYAQNLRIEIEPINGHQIERAVTDIVIEQEPLGDTTFKFSDILAEETRNFVFDAKLLKQAKFGPRAVNLFLVRAHYVRITDKGLSDIQTVETKVKAQFVQPDEAQKDPHKDLDEVIALAQVVRAQLNAEELAKKGAFADAARVMTDVATNFTQRGLTSTAKVAANVGHRLDNAASYASSAGYLRSVAYGGTRAMGLSMMDSDARADLLSCNVSLENGSMTSSVQAFTQESWQIQPPAPQVTPSVGPSLVSHLYIPSEPQNTINILETLKKLPEVPPTPLDMVIDMGDPAGDISFK